MKSKKSDPYLYRRIESFELLGQRRVTVFERRNKNPNGRPDLNGPAVVVARFNGRQEFLRTASFAAAAVDMENKGSKDREPLCLHCKTFLDGEDCPEEHCSEYFRTLTIARK